jgi:hypothetical protein
MFKGEDHEQKPAQSPTQERNTNSRDRRDEPIQSNCHSSTSIASTPFSLYNTTISTHETSLLAFELGLKVGSKKQIIDKHIVNIIKFNNQSLITASTFCSIEPLQTSSTSRSTVLLYS